MDRILNQVAEISREGSSEVDSNVVISKICLSMSELLDLHDLVFYTVSEVNQLREYVTIKKKMGYHLTLNTSEPLCIPFGEGIVGSSAMHRTKRRVNDISLCSEYIPGIPGAISELCLPVIHHGKVLGVLDSESTKSRFFTNTMIDVFQICSHFIIPHLGETECRKNSSSKSRFKEFLFLLDQEKWFRDHSVSQQKIATRMNLSSQYLSKIISENSGQTFTDLLHDLRISLAKELLQDGLYSGAQISDIYFEVGYHSRSSFNAQFKKRTGLTPVQFRKK